MATPNNLYFRITPNRSSYSDYAHVYVEVYRPRLNDNGFPSGEFERADYRYNEPAGSLYLENLVVKAQVHNGADHLYGYQVEFQNVSVSSPETCQAMARTLTKIRKGLRDLDDRFGTTRSFSEYVCRLAEVLKIQGTVNYHEGDDKWWVTSRSNLHNAAYSAAYQACQLIGVNTDNVTL